MKKIIPDLFPVLLLLIISAFASPAVAHEVKCEGKEDLVLGMSAAFTGPSRGLGIELYRGSMAYFTHLNKLGGIQGRKVVIKAYDDAYDPIPCIDNTIQLLEKDEVLLLYNYVGTPTVTRILPLIKSHRQSGALLFFPFTGAQPQREAPYTDQVFNLRASYRQETKGLVNNFVEVGRTRVAVFYQADAYGRSGWDGVKRALERHGLKMAGEATYRRGAKYQESMQAQVEIIRATNPDAIISIGSYAACAAFIRDFRDAGLDMPIANVSFVGSENLLELLMKSEVESGRDYTSNLINSQVVPTYEDTSLQAVREYRGYMDAYPIKPPEQFDTSDYVPLRYSFVSLEGFFNAKVMAYILNLYVHQEGKQSIAEVAESVRGLDIGIDMPVRFGPSKHQGLEAVYFTTVQEGKFIPIKDFSRWAR